MTPEVGGVEIEYPGFGEIVIEAKTYHHDIVIERGEVRERDKGPSRPLERDYGHTPLSPAEDIPWSGPRLIIGSGYSGRLPVLKAVEEIARSRQVELEVMPTAEACDVLSTMDQDDVTAVLHITC